MTTVYNVREQRTERVGEIDTLKKIDSPDSHAFYNAGEDLGAWTLKPKSRPFVNIDGYEHVEYKTSRSGDRVLDKFGNPIVERSMNEVLIFNRDTNRYEAIPMGNVLTNHVIVDHNEMMGIIEAWVGVGAIPELIHLSNDKATFSGVVKVPDMFTKFSGIDAIFGKLVFQNNITGQKKFSIKFAAERYVCVNMIYFTGRNDQHQFTTKHTTHIGVRISERIEMQHEKIREVAVNMENGFVELANVNMNENQTVDFLRKFLVKSDKRLPARTNYSDLADDPKLGRTKNNIDQKIREISLIASGNGLQGDTVGSTGGSAYAVYQAILEHSDWYRDNSITSDSYSKVRNDRSLQALGIGNNDQVEHYKKHALTAIGLEAENLAPSFS